MCGVDGQIPAPGRRPSGHPETHGSWPGPQGHRPQRERIQTRNLLGFLFFCFLLPTSPFCSGGACYVSRGGKKNAGREAKVTRTAETFRSAAATAGSQVNTGVVCGFAFSRKGEKKKKKPAFHILRIGLKAMISSEDPVTEMSPCAACVPRPPVPPRGSVWGSGEACPERVLRISHLVPARMLWDLYFSLKKPRGFWTGSCRDIPKARGPPGIACPLARPDPCFHWGSRPVCPRSLWTTYLSALCIYEALGAPPSTRQAQGLTPQVPVPRVGGL